MNIQSKLNTQREREIKMLTQKQWKTQHLAEHMLGLATAAATEAAHLSSMRHIMVKDHAVVAEEIKRISMRVIETLEQNIYGGLSDESFAEMVINYSEEASFLALNAALVACCARENKAMAVFAEELRSFSLELGELFGKKYKYTDIPEVLPKSSVVPDTFYMVRATSGNHVWVENAQFVWEFLMYCPEYIKDGRLVIKNEFRDIDIPFIKLGDVPENPGIIIISNVFDRNKKYAVLAEFNLHSLANSHIGVSKECKASIPLRECWSASDGSDLIFPDWEKLSNDDKGTGSLS